MTTPNTTQRTTMKEQVRQCDNCAARGPWRTERIGHGRNAHQVQVADCQSQTLPYFWAGTGKKPFVFPGCGSKCELFEPLGTSKPKERHTR